MKTICSVLLREALRADRECRAPRRPGMITLAVLSDLGGSHLHFTSTIADRANRCRVTPAYRNGTRWIPTNGA